MRIDLASATRVKNPDVLNKKVTLGRRTFTSKNMLGTGCPFARVAVDVSDGLGVWSMMSGNSTGKSVLLKRIYQGMSLIWRDRPILILDMQGKDHRLSKYKSRVGFLFTDIGEYRWGFGDRQINMTPAFLKKSTFDRRFPDEEYFAIDWTTLSPDEWEYLLIELSGSSAQSWVQSFRLILSKILGAGINSLSSFMDILSLELHKSSAERKNDPSIYVPYEISPAEIKNMMKALEILRDRSFVVDPGDKLAKTDPLALLLDGRVVNISFHGEESVEVQLYVGILLRKIYEYYDYYADIAIAEGRFFNGPIIVIEEFNKLVPVQERSGLESPALKVTRGIINQGMKNRLLFLLAFQDAHDIDTKLRRALFSGVILACNLNVSDMKILADKEGSQLKPFLQALDLEWDEYKSKEWAIIKDRIVWSFRPGGSPAMFHDRFNQSNGGDFN